MTTETKPLHLREGELRYAPAEVNIEAEPGGYVIIPIGVLMGPGAPKGYVERLWRQEFAKGFWDVWGGLERLSALFGIRPAVRPVFCDFREGPVGRGAPRGEVKFIMRPTWDLYAWLDDFRPHLMISELRGGELRLRDGPGLYRSAVHEFAHGLQERGLVDWEYDLDGGKCSSSVREFAEVVSRRCAGDYIRLSPSRSERGEPDYEPLARECRVRQGLPPHPTFEELGLSGKFGIVRSL